MRRRAVSDTVGFVLVFGLVVSTVGVVYVGGLEALTATRDTQQFANTERAFDVLDANVEDHSVRGAPRRNTELLLKDGALEFGPPVTFNVTNGSTNYYATTFRPIVYRADDGDRLVYSNGALFRQYDDSAVMFDEPRFVAGDRTFVPYVVTRDRSNNVSAEGARRLLVRTSVSGREVREFDDASLNLTVTSPRAAAWERYFESELGLPCTRPAGGSPDTVTCSLPTDDVYVQAVVLDVSFT